MKACNTISAAMGVAIAAGVVAAGLSSLVLFIAAPAWTAIGATVACLVVGFTALLMAYPRWESDL